jgi:DNA-directed RNA polymerase specialized sigma24 family protein
MHPDDKELLFQFRVPATKERAFNAIVKKYQEKLYWHIRRMVINHEDANDVLQNVFIKVWNALSSSGRIANCIPGCTGSLPMNV